MAKIEGQYPTPFKGSLRLFERKEGGIMVYSSKRSGLTVCNPVYSATNTQRPDDDVKLDDRLS